MKKVLMTIGVTLAFAASAHLHAQKIETRPPTESVAEVRRIIEKANAQWVEAWAKGDASMTASLFAEDGVQLAGQGKLVKGRQAIFERQKAAMAGVDPGVKVTVTTVDVWLDGDTAYETGKYKYEYTEKGKPAPPEEGRYVTIWKKRKDGNWKLSMDMGVPQDK